MTPNLAVNVPVVQQMRGCTSSSTSQEQRSLVLMSGIHMPLEKSWEDDKQEAVANLRDGGYLA
eukprot:scaffold608722_cov34-Prasinocladus_malaysianus.AAC.1